MQGNSYIHLVKGVVHCAHQRRPLQQEHRHTARDSNLAHADYWAQENVPKHVIMSQRRLEESG